MLIKFNRRFKKDQHKAPLKIKIQFERRLLLFVKNRTAVILNNHGLTGKWKGYRSINITGDWRAIFFEPEDGETIFAAFGTHSQLYW